MGGIGEKGVINQLLIFNMSTLKLSRFYFAREKQSVDASQTL